MKDQSKTKQVLIRELAFLRQRIAELEQLESERNLAEHDVIQVRKDWENIFQAIGHPTVILDPQHKIIAANKAVVCASDLSLTELLGKKCCEIFHDKDTISPPKFCPMESLLASGQVETEDMEMEAFGGVFLVSCTPVFDQQGRIEKIIHIATDITDRKQAEDEIRCLNADLEQRVIDRTAQLEIANRELESFTYSASHDLKGPLRAVDGYARILIEDYAVRLDGEGRRVCEVISNNTRKMGQLIDALLALSRTGRIEMHPAPVDMATMANEAFFELTTPEGRERIDFHVGSMPRAVCDPMLLRQVWVNLIGNAVKFSARKEQAVIEAGCLSEGSEHPSAGDHETDVSIEHLPFAIPIPNAERVYFVRDKGAGFDMAYVDKLFGVFQRLHSEKEFEGTGAGLAIVQRIIQRHGGRIWAEGEVGKGATFYFSICKA
ncbi:MAG TPA: hypothetical protein DCG53_14110 [Syntrophus sp. (in: bacteria)]|jgi:PAS domain S-box-containing protein|nr:hypothetical protein [Syntrophus sp. (in: bacteria)]